jgi:hypothetical protein
MPVAIRSNNGTGRGSHRRAASASDRTPDDRTSHGAASCGTLCHNVRCGHGKTQQQQN